MKDVVVDEVSERWTQVQKFSLRTGTIAPVLKRGTRSLKFVDLCSADAGETPALQR